MAVAQQTGTAIPNELDPGQRRIAKLLFRLARLAGLSERRAREFVHAAWSESKLRPGAVNPSSGAAGLFQLLSQGYRETAKRLGGLFNATANAKAILPSYVDYWAAHPNAEPGAGGRDVERSGAGADFYSNDLELFAWLDDGTAGTPEDEPRGRPFRLRQWLSVPESVDVERVHPDLLARVWALAAKLGKKITVRSGYRSNAEQAAIYADYRAGNRAGPVAAPGTSNHERGLALDLEIEDALGRRRAIADVVNEQTLNDFGLRSLRHIGDPPHVELAATREGVSFDPARDSSSPATVAAAGTAIAAAGVGLAPKILPWFKRLWRGRRGGTATGTGTGIAIGSTLAKATGLGAVLAALGVGNARSVRYAALWLLITLGGLGLVALGVLRMLGVRSNDVVQITLNREVT